MKLRWQVESQRAIVWRSVCTDQGAVLLWERHMSIWTVCMSMNVPYTLVSRGCKIDIDESSNAREA